MLGMDQTMPVAYDCSAHAKGMKCVFSLVKAKRERHCSYLPADLSSVW